MDKEKLNRKLAGWRGFAVGGGTTHYYVDPEGKPCDLPNFVGSLDACFKWLVPKLPPPDILFYRKFGKWEASLEFYQDPWESIESAETPAHALCLAIEKLIDSETT